MINNNLKLIVVADTGYLKIFEAQGLKIVRNIEDLDLKVLLDHHARQEKHQGNFHHGSNPSHFFDPHTSPKELDRHSAAQLVATHVERLLTDTSHYKELIIIADPKSLGQIRQCLNTKAKALISKEIPKDLTHQSAEAIENIIFS